MVKAGNEWRARPRARVLLILLLLVALAPAQAPQKPPPKSAVQRQLEAATRSLLAVIRTGAPTAALPQLSPRGVVLDLDGERHSITDIRRHFAQRTGLYCRWFDTACLRREMEEQSADIETQRTPDPRSYRELLRLVKSVEMTSLAHPDQPGRGLVSVCVRGPEIAPAGAGYLLEFGFERVGGAWKLAMEEGNFAGC